MGGANGCSRSVQNSPYDINLLNKKTQSMQFTRVKSMQTRQQRNRSEQAEVRPSYLANRDVILAYSPWTVG